MIKFRFSKKRLDQQEAAIAQCIVSSSLSHFTKMNEVDQLFLRTSSLVSQCPTKIIIIESFSLALPFSPVGLRNHGADNRELVDHGRLLVVLIGLNQDLRHLHRCEVCLFQACDVLLHCCSLGTLPLVLSVAKSRSG